MYNTMPLFFCNVPARDSWLEIIALFCLKVQFVIDCLVEYDESKECFFAEIFY